MKSQRLKNFLLLALFMMGAVSISGQTDVTDTYLKNPSFEDNFTSWTNDGLATQSNTSFTKKEGSIYIEKWVSTESHVGDASVSQTVTTLDNGVYKLTVAAQNIQQNSASVQTGAYIFADDNEVSVGAANDYSVTFTVIDGEVTIGFKSVGATGNWISCDNFRLYLVNQDVSAILSELQNRIDIAKGLVGQKMQTSLLNQLNVAIADAEKEVEAGTGGNVVAVAKALRIAIDASETSVKSYAELQAVIDEAEEAYGDGELNGADSFNEAIQKAKSTVEAEESTSEDLALAVVDLQQALLAFRILNASGEIPEVVTNSFIARGSTMMFGRSTVKVPSGIKILEQGFCWSTNPEPTILDNRTTEYLNNNGHIYIMRNVQPSTVYYVRAYAMTENYAVGYGDVIKVITIPSGGITFTYDYGAPADANKRIVNALTSAVEYWNNLTSIKGLNISCHYGSGTPTADCSYGGGMRVGPNASYQRTGTILHEMGHAVGVGTHSIWNASDFKIDCCAGEEKSIAATKSLTAQMICCTLLVLKYASYKGIDIVPYLEQLKTLPEFVRKTFELQPEVKKVAQVLSEYKNLVVTADGISYALAREASLKIKETSYINVYSSILGEFMHGHVAVMNNKIAQIHISVDDLSYTAIKNLNKIKEDYKPVLCILGNSNEKVTADYNVNIDCESEIVKSFCLVVICQLLALEIAKKLKRNVDKPHGLHKVVK